MKKTTYATIAVLAFGLSTSVLTAQYSRYRSPYPSPRDMERVAALAHRVEEIAEIIHATAERNNRRPSRSESHMLTALHELDDAAEHFHDQVESYSSEPQHTEEDFETLLDSFDSAASALTYTRRRPYVDRGMDQIALLLSELNRYYGRPDRYRDWRHGYDRPRFDHRGYDRYDDDRWDHDEDSGDFRPPRPH